MHLIALQIPNTGEAKRSLSFHWAKPKARGCITVTCCLGGTLVGAVGRAGGGAVSRAGGGLQFDQQEEWAESHQVELALCQVLEEVNGLLKSELAESKKNIVALQMAVADLEEQLQTKTAELERMDGQILAALMG